MNQYAIDKLLEQIVNNYLNFPLPDAKAHRRSS